LLGFNWVGIDNDETNNDDLSRIPNLEEVKVALFNINSSKIVREKLSFKFIKLQVQGTSLGT